MKTLKLLGVAALTALLVFGVVACAADPEYLDDADLIVTSFHGPYVGKEITATWDGSTPKEVNFEWKFNGASDKTEGAEESKFTPTAAGTLELVVSAEGYESLSKTIVIEPAPLYVDYFGIWLMNAQLSENSAWLNNTTDGGNFNETVTITEKLYELKSSKQSKKKENGVEVGDPLDEFFDFTITSWAAKSSASTVDGAYTSGYTITGKVDSQHGGYGTTLTSFAIYLHPTDKSLQVSDRNTNANVKRYYKRSVPFTL
jgi:hypothetical protein